MAKQKQINLQVLLLMTGVFFTALSAAKACFAPYVSIYLRQLGLSAMQVGIIFGCQGLVVACTASCIGRFLMRFKSARVFLLLAIVMYLGGVLGFTIIPTSSTALFQLYCRGSADLSNASSSSAFLNADPSIQPSKSHPDVVSNAVTTISPVTRAISIKIESSSKAQDVELKATVPTVPVTAVRKVTDSLAEDGESLIQKENILDDEDPKQIAQPQYENMLSHKTEEFDAQSAVPTVETFVRSNHRPGYSRPYPRVQDPRFQDDRYSPRKRYRGQPVYPGRYMESPDTAPKWNWQTEREMDFDRETDPAWEWEQDRERLQQSEDDNDGYREDVLDWLLRNGAGRASSRSPRFSRNRVRRSVANETTDVTVSIQPSVESTNKISEASSHSSTRTFWLALLVVVITALFAGPIEHMCDTALYHQLDNIDELDKYKRPSLLTMPAFATMGLVSALVVESTGCFLYGDTSHMTIHFYLSAAFIGVVFLVGIIVPLSHKIKTQQEGKYLKSMKFLYSDGHTAVMCATLVMTAMISSCSDGFLFWLIQDLQGLETTMGVSLAVAYMSELPMSMIFTPWLVQKLGNVWLLALGSACLGLQNLYYSILWTPWAVVPIQILHALGRSAIRGCILAFLNEASPPGMGKAIQVTVLALEQGLGMALGSILWGVLYGFLTAKLIFVAAAIMALIWTVVLIICACRLPTKKRFMYAKLLQSDMEMDMTKGGAFGSDSEDNEEKQWLHDAIRDEDEEEE